MDEHDWLAERFEENRPHLRAVAYRVLGSASEADDAVQEAWLRFSRSGADGVENLGGWLTTIVARVSLNMLTRACRDGKSWWSPKTRRPSTRRMKPGRTLSTRQCWRTRSAWPCSWCWTR